MEGKIKITPKNHKEARKHDFKEFKVLKTDVVAETDKSILVNTDAMESAGIWFNKKYCKGSMYTLYITVSIAKTLDYLYEEDINKKRDKDSKAPSVSGEQVMQFFDLKA